MPPIFKLLMVAFFVPTAAGGACPAKQRAAAGSTSIETVGRYKPKDGW